MFRQIEYFVLKYFLQSSKYFFFFIVVKFGRIWRFGGSAEPAGTVDRTTTEPNLSIYRRFYDFLGGSQKFFKILVVQVMSFLTKEIVCCQKENVS